MSLVLSVDECVPAALPRRTSVGPIRLRPPGPSDAGSGAAAVPHFPLPPHLVGPELINANMCLK